MEGDEECDAGLLGSEDNDPCCDKVCKLRRNQGAVCRLVCGIFKFYLCTSQKFVQILGVRLCFK